MVTTLRKGYKFCGYNNCGKIVKEPKCFCYIHEGKAITEIANEVKRLKSLQTKPSLPFRVTIDQLEESEESNYEYE
jgi:hypothetical protein